MWKALTLDLMDLVNLGIGSMDLTKGSCLIKQDDTVNERVDNSCMHPDVMNNFPSQRLLVLAGTIAASNAMIMVDSGASRNFVSINFTQKVSIKIYRSLRYKVRLVDVTKYTEKGPRNRSGSISVHIEPAPILVSPSRGGTCCKNRKHVGRFFGPAKYRKRISRFFWPR